MQLADITLLIFTIGNSIRVAAYLPQIWKAATDKNGAQAISFATWSLFLMSHLTTVAYALVNRSDWTMAAIFLTNAVGCSAILGFAVWRRATFRRAERASADTVIPFRKRAAG